MVSIELRVWDTTVQLTQVTRDEADRLARQLVPMLRLSQVIIDDGLLH